MNGFFTLFMILVIFLGTMGIWAISYLCWKLYKSIKHWRKGVHE